MQRLMIRLSVAFLTFAVGVGCAVLFKVGDARPLPSLEGLIQSSFVLYAGLVCLALAAASERARKDKVSSDVAYSLLWLCCGVLLLLTGIGMFGGLLLR